MKLKCDDCRNADKCLDKVTAVRVFKIVKASEPYLKKAKMTFTMRCGYYEQKT